MKVPTCFFKPPGLRSTSKRYLFLFRLDGAWKRLWPLGEGVMSYIFKSLKLKYLLHSLSENQADIRVKTGDPTGSLPYTLHSGKCGVPGNFIMLPAEYVEDLEESVVGKIMKS